MKSPAMAEALRMLQAIEAIERLRFREEMEDYRRLSKEYKLRKSAADSAVKKKLKDDNRADISADMPDEPREPVRRQLIVTDTTYEALADILSNNPNGVLAYRDELMGLLRVLDREDNAAARAFYLTAWNGTDSYTVDRVMSGHQHLEAVCVSMVGSTQPGRIQEYVRRALFGGGGDDGLIQRFSLLVWPDTGKTWRHVDRFPDADAAKAASEVFKRLGSPKKLTDISEFDATTKMIHLKFDDAASTKFIEWLGQLERRLRAGDLHPAVESHLGKYRKLVPALALVNHLIDDAGKEVGLESLDRAIAVDCRREVTR